MDDVIILGQPRLIRLYQRRGGSLQPAPNQFICPAFDSRSAHPPAGKLHQRLPLAFKLQLHLNAYHPVVVIFRLGFQPLAALEQDRLQRVGHRWLLEADVIRRGMREARCARGAAGAQDGSQFLEANSLRHVMENQGAKGTTNRHFASDHMDFRVKLSAQSD